MRHVEETAPSDATGKRGQPVGVKLLIFCELCERFSFFGMMGILAFFLTATVEKGGFNWSDGRSVTFVGLYAGLVYFGGLGGGLIADKWIGPHRAVYVGGSIISAGHLILVFPEVIPRVLEAFTTTPVAHLLGMSKVALGSLAISASALNSITAVAANSKQVGVLHLAYLLSSWSFHAGIACLVIGTGLFKPNIAVLLGNLYGTCDPRREGGFILFYIGINVGSTLAPLIVGTIGELVGWSYGFAAAGIGMLIAMSVFAYSLRREAIREPTIPREKEMETDTANPNWNWLCGFAILVLSATVFWAGAEQMFGYLNLFVFNQTDRRLGTMEVPATWFQALNPIFIILLAPMFARLWQSLEQQNGNPHIVWKFVVGLSILGLSFLVMRSAAIMFGGTGEGSGMGWISLTYFLETLSELTLWVTGLAMVSRLAPPKYRGSAMGLWYTSMAMGNWLAGAIGEVATHIQASAAFTYMAAMQFAAAIVLGLLSQKVIHWIDD